MANDRADGLVIHELINPGRVFIAEVASSPSIAPETVPSKRIEPRPIEQPRRVPERVADRPFVPAIPPAPPPIAAPQETPVPQSQSDSHFTREIENFHARQAHGQPGKEDPMAGDSHAPAGGGGGGTGGKLGGYIWIAVGALLAIILLIHLGNILFGTGYRANTWFAPQQSQGFIPTANWPAVTQSPRGQGMPSPEEVYNRQLQAGNVKTTRTPVPCIAGYVYDAGSGLCNRTRWVPN